MAISIPSNVPKESCRLNWRMLAGADIRDLRALRAKVLADLPDPDFYVREDDEESFLRHLCGQGGQTYGVFDKNRLVAYGAISFPGACDQDNLGILLGFEQQECALVAHIASCMVLPAYRGFALQQELLRARFALARACGRRYAIAIVSLKNNQSRHNMLLQGMSVRWIGELCGGLKRQLLVKDLFGRCPLVSTHAALRLAADDYEAQQKAVKTGLEGRQDVSVEGRYFIEFFS